MGESVSGPKVELSPTSVSTFKPERVTFKKQPTSSSTSYNLEGNLTTIQTVSYKSALKCGSELRSEFRLFTAVILTHTPHARVRAIAQPQHDLGSV